MGKFFGAFAFGPDETGTARIGAIKDAFEFEIEGARGFEGAESFDELINVFLVPRRYEGDVEVVAGEPADVEVRIVSLKSQGFVLDFL